MVEFRRTSLDRRDGASRRLIYDKPNLYQQTLGRFKMSTQAILQSTQDESVNFVTRGAFPGLIEARYVRRSKDYFIIYVSSQTGCTKACRMCHLTQSGQTNSVDIPLDSILEQADRVFDWYDTQESPATVVHINFMARGEPFANQFLLDNVDVLLSNLADRAISRSLIPRFKFSTIMPNEIRDIQLARLFPRHNPDIYYSIYSASQSFRKKWLPKALPVEIALVKLKEYQRVTRKIPVLHWAFIAGENDDEATINRICELVREYALRVDVNIVRYNPFSTGQGCEPPAHIIERNSAILQGALPGTSVKIVSRVGFDVNASCGMFVAASGGQHT